MDAAFRLELAERRDWLVDLRMAAADGKAFSEHYRRLSKPHR